MSPGSLPLAAAEPLSPNSEMFDYFMLIAILALILGLAVYAVRIWGPRFMANRNLSSGPIRIAARCTLEPRKNLYIVQAGADYFLVATSESAVHHLAQLDTDRVEASLTESSEARSRTFGDLIRRRSGSS